MQSLAQARGMSPPATVRPVEFHRQRRAAMLAQRPELKQLFGYCPAVAPVTVLLVATQFSLAALLAQAPWWGGLAAAFFVGAFISHCLNVVIHESTHNLVLRTTAQNKAVMIIANLPGVLPGALAFRHYHLMHHQFLGEPRGDPDVGLPWEARLVGASPIRKFLWLLVLPLVYGLVHPAQARKHLPFDRWLAANVVGTCCCALAVLLLLGWPSLLYLAFSVYFAVGLHPTGAHALQEHIHFAGHSYATASYYGPINALSLNHGYHLEHHDFSGIPGPRLPKLRRLAPEFYDGRFAHPSRLATLWQFVFDRRVTLASRSIVEPRSPRLRAERRAAA